MPRSFRILWLMLLPVFSSCEKDIPVDVPPHVPVLVLNSVNRLGEEFEAELSRTVPIIQYNGNEDLVIRDALVLLYSGDGLLDTLEYNTDRDAYLSDMRPLPGHAYTLVAIKEGYKNIEATTDVPSIVQLTLERKEKVTTGRFNAVMDELIASFRDSATAVADFYRIRVTKVTASMQYYTSSCIESADPSVANLLEETIGEEKCLKGEGMYLQDQYFNGSFKSLHFFIQSDELEPVTDSTGNSSYVLVKLEHLSEPYYRYLKTTAYLIHNDQNPFAEPTNAYTNVKNGFGIFTVISSNQRSIR